VDSGRTKGRHGADRRGSLAAGPTQGAPRRARGCSYSARTAWSKSVWQVDPQALKHLGIRGVILDLDNTLGPLAAGGDDRRGHHLARRGAGGRHQALHPVQLAIKQSLEAGSRQRLGVANVDKARKPSLNGFRRAMAAMGTEPATTAIVGDQMFTDILGGNRSGIYTVMVRPIHHHEFAYTRFVSRPPERYLLKVFKRRGHLEGKDEGAETKDEG